MTQAAAIRKQPRKEPIYARMQGGVLVPADVFARKQLERKKLQEGSIVKLYVSKLRNPKFNRLVHKLGILVTQNIEAFSGLDAHKAIKRLQIEGRIACDEIGVMVPGYGMVIQFIPRSLSFDSMDEAEFHDAARQICRLIAERYWSNMEPEKIEQMAGCMVDE